MMHIGNGMSVPMRVKRLRANASALRGYLLATYADVLYCERLPFSLAHPSTQPHCRREGPCNIQIWVRADACTQGGAALELLGHCIDELDVWGRLATSEKLDELHDVLAVGCALDTLEHS